MKLNKIKVLYSALMAASGLALVACNGGSNADSSGSNGSGASISAMSPTQPVLYGTSACVSASVSLSNSAWYTSGTINLINNCNTQQNLTGQAVTLTSQDQTGKLVALGIFNNWWVNNTAYVLNFVTTSGNTQSGTISAGTATPILLANQTISFSGGANLNGSIYDLATAQKSITVGGTQPVVQTGTLTVSVDTRNAGCSGTLCSNISVAIKDPNGNTVQTINVPTANTNAVYTQAVTNLAVNSYTLQASIINGDSISYIPSAVLAVPANGNASGTVTYTQPVVANGNATIKIPTVVSSYTGALSVNLINTKASNTVVASYSLAQGATQTTAQLPISDSSHAYSLQVQGIGDPLNGVFYGQSSLPTLTIKANQTTTITAALVKSSIKTNKVTFNLSGLAISDSAGISFQDVATPPKYAYIAYNSLKNGAASYSFESGSNLGYVVKATGTNYVTNPLLGTGVINAVQNFSVAFESPVTPGGATVAGWPSYLAMGAVGGPNIDPLANVTSGGDDSFGGKPVDAVFKYAGVNGNGDPGVIDPPMNVVRMTNDLNNVSAYNKHASRVVIVEYTGEMSGGENFADFTNTNVANPNKQNATYIMARHFASLSADAMALSAKPIVYNSQKYYGSLIMNPDLLGAMQQNGYVTNVNAQLSAGVVNTAVDQALCLLTTSRSYSNTSAPNGANGQIYINKTYTGTPYQILDAMLRDGYPAWSFSGSSDAFWNTSINNDNSAVGDWFKACVSQPAYNTTLYARPNFSAGFDGWVQANNWLIRTFAAKNTVTFGWQDNMWASGSGFWMHRDLTSTQISSTYSTPIANWLNSNAPSSINNVGAAYAPDFFVFDRYEMDDSAAPGQATFYSARSWDNFLTAVGQVSKAFKNIPLMLWQIPGSHLPNTTESAPQLFNSIAGQYVFSTAPVYFFGDNNLKSDLSNMIQGSGSTTNQLVGNYVMTILGQADTTDGYHCPVGICTNYKQYLRYYNGAANNYDWSKDNKKLAMAASNNVFSILWGGGNTTNVIKNFSNPTDNGWLANKLIQYYQQPTSLK